MGNYEDHKELLVPLSNTFCHCLNMEEYHKAQNELLRLMSEKDSIEKELSHIRQYLLSPVRIFLPFSINYL